MCQGRRAINLEGKGGGMSARDRLPDRRESEICSFTHDGGRFAVGISRYPAGHLAEIFISSDRPGSAVEAIARDGAIALSFALQHGASLKSLRAAMTRGHDGGPATLLAAALDAIGGD
jgi:hypothetical protein